jgi:hypothetical protein
VSHEGNVEGGREGSKCGGVRQLGDERFRIDIELFLFDAGTQVQI